VIVLSPEGELSFIQKGNISLRVLPFRKSLLAPIGLHLLMRKHNYTHIICNFWILSAAACLLSIVHPGLRVFLWEHGYEVNETNIFRTVRAFLLFRLSGIIVVSKRMKAYAEHRFRNRLKVSVMYNPIPTHLVGPFTNQRHNTRDTHGVRVVCVSRLVPGKGLHTLLSAWDMVRRECSARLLIVGSGPLLGELRHQALSLGIRDVVDFVGFRPDPIPEIVASQLLVLPSECEGFGLPVIEALLNGVQVVVTRCGSVFEELEESELYGTLVPVGDDCKLAEAIIESLKHPREFSFRSRGLFAEAECYERLKAILL